MNHFLGPKQCYVQGEKSEPFLPTPANTPRGIQLTGVFLHARLESPENAYKER